MGNSVIVSKYDLKYIKGQYNPAGFQICGAPMPDGAPCPSTILEPNGRCKKHQMWELGEYVDPELLTRYGPDLPQDALGRVKRALEDPELLDLKENIRLFDARIGELLSQLDDGYAGDYPSLGKAISAYERLKYSQDVPSDALEGAWNAIKEQLGSGDRKTAIWGQIERLTAQRTKLVDQQMKREAFLQQHIPVQRLMALVNVLTQMMKQRAIDAMGEEDAMKFMASVKEQWGMLLQAGE